MRNPNGTRSTDTVRKALPDKIVDHDGPGASTTSTSGSSRNQADSTSTRPVCSPPARSQILADPTFKKRRDNRRPTFLRYLTVFQKNAPFDNIHCRNAVAYAIDKKAQQLARGGPNGGGRNRDDDAAAVAEVLPEVRPVPDGRVTPATSRRPSPSWRLWQAERFHHRRSPAGATARKSPGDRDAGRPGEDRHQGVDRPVRRRRSTSRPSSASRPTCTSRATAWRSPPGVRTGRRRTASSTSSWTVGRSCAQGNSNYGELNDPAVNNGIDAGACRNARRRSSRRTGPAVDKAVVGSAALHPAAGRQGLPGSLPRARRTCTYTTRYNGDFDFAVDGRHPVRQLPLAVTADGSARRRSTSDCHPWAAGTR